MPGWEQAVVPIVGAILGMLGGGGDKQSNEAVAGQLGLSRQLMDMLQRQQNVALPYQQSILSMLQGRAQQNSLPLGPFLSRPTQPPWVKNVGGRPVIGKPALGGQ